ncbi:hypothetical protein ABT095_27795 [Kitasatospora sp. NPDC002227]|uniref:hypothetical protein n=1 Tax=Kitasatospora sp. NPDC002227 TaxID=3154773 RepID=UPI00331E2FED
MNSLTTSRGPLRLAPPDPRSEFLVPDFEDMEELIAGLVVPANAPMAVMSALGTSRELLRFSFYRYEFATVAVTHSLVALELALTERLADRGPLPDLVERAAAEGHLKADLAGALDRALALPGDLARGVRTSAAFHPSAAVTSVRAVFDAVAALLGPAAEPADPDDDSLVRLRDEHRHMRFPPGFQGAELAGADLVLVDLWVAGLVDRELKGTLDETWTGELWGSINALDKAIPLMHEPYCASYFTKLRRLAMAVAERHVPGAVGMPRGTGGPVEREAEQADGDGRESLVEAFPHELAADVRAVLALLPEAKHRSCTFAVRVGAEDLAIPSRIYHGELPSTKVELLPPQQRQLLHCLYTRHHDGRVRQRHLAQLLTSTAPWVVPYTVQLLGEYVLEILTDLRDGYRELLAPGSEGRSVYGRFVVDNPEFFARTERRVVSYWNEYHRRSWYADFRGYPGGTALDHLRDAASDQARRPWPNHTPGRCTRLDRYC